MKTPPRIRLLQSLLALSLLACVPAAFAQLTIPGADGSDGALNVTVSTNIDLGRAVNGNWDANNAANAGRGIYDVSKWAVVFKYASVNIAPGAIVTFSNHPSRAPVVWLVSSNVTIAGVVDLNGAVSFSGANAPETAPGGFRAGFQGAGLGPGGANAASANYGPGQSRAYGNPQIVPLIGGSGGTASGSGGGGAILIAVSRTNTISGSILARGGVIAISGHYGSGGAIRLVADHIAGDGAIDATSYQYSGRVRLEANTVSPSLQVLPITQAVPPNPVVLWPDTNAPIVRVISVSGQAAPLDPRAVIENNPADVNIATTNSATVLLETKNFPTNGTVNVFVKPRNAAQTTYQAAWVSGTTNTSTWQVEHVFLPGYAVIQARAVTLP